MSFIQRLKEARKNAGLTQVKLGEIIGVASSTVAGYETGNSEPSMRIIRKIMDATGVDANYLWQDEMQGDVEEKTAQPKNVVAFQSRGFGIIGEARNPEYTHRYNSLDKEARSRVKNVLDYEYNKLIERREKERVTLIAPTQSVCAGQGNYLDTMEYDTIDVVKNKYTYGATHIVKLQGDSMEPEFHDGDRLIVTETKGERPINGRVGIFVVNNDAFLRQLIDGVLHPYNPLYSDVKPGEYDDIRYIGYVVGILDDSWVIE